LTGVVTTAESIKRIASAEASKEGGKEGGEGKEERKSIFF